MSSLVSDWAGCLLPARADSEVQRSKAITPSPSQAAVPEPICLLARGESFNRRNSLVLPIRGFCLFRANEWTSPGAGAAGGMIGDRVVVSELRGVEPPADSLADLRFRCPVVTVVVRLVLVTCGPSAARHSLSLVTIASGAPVRQTWAMTEAAERRYLIVADHSLDEQQLAAKVHRALAAGPSRFYLLVLAAPVGSKDHFLWNVAAGGFGIGSAASVPNPGPAEALGWDRASDHLAHDLVRLRRLGVDADGETGEPPPLRAIREVLTRHPADEIILATAPHHVTRLLAMDLQQRAHRSFGVPVTVLGSTRADSQDQRS